MQTLFVFDLFLKLHSNSMELAVERHTKTQYCVVKLHLFCALSFVVFDCKNQCT